MTMPRDDDSVASALGSASAAPGAASTDTLAQYQDRINSLQRRLDDVPDKLRLSQVRDQVGDLEAQSNRVADLANAVRELGYAWDKDLEPRCLDYRRRWQDVKPNVLAAIDRESASLAGRQTQVTYQVNWAIQHSTTPQEAAANLPEGERVLDQFERDADAAANSIRGMYGQFSTDLNALEEHLKQVKWMLDQAAQSRVSWLPQEAVVQVVKAQWDRDGKDDPRGLLLLSDQRVLFERDEEVATKKVLFVTTARQHVQEVMVDLPLAQLTNVAASKRGLMGHEDHLDLTFAPGARLRAAHFHLDGQDCNQWQELVNRAKSGGLEDTRVKLLSAEEQARLKNAPTHCVNCGGALSAPVLRGQTEIKCPYCGTVNRF
jgi:uncharacterized Zn-finger protein